MAGAGDLYALGASVLQAAEDALGANSITAPATRYVCLGVPALDCELLVASWGQADTVPLSPTGLGSQLHRLQGGWTNLTSWTVWCIRCAPVSAAPSMAGYLPPTVAQEDALSSAALGDAWALWNGFAQQFRQGLALGPFPCRGAVLGPTQAVTPQGGLAGCALSVQLDLDGYTLEPWT